MSRKQVAVSSNYWEGEVVFWTPYDPYDSVTYDKFCGQVAKEARNQKGANVYWARLKDNGVLNVSVLAQRNEDRLVEGQNLSAPLEPEAVPKGWVRQPDGSLEPINDFYEAGGPETYRRRAG